MRLVTRTLRRDDLPRAAELAREVFFPLRVDAFSLERNLLDDEGADGSLRRAIEEKGRLIACAAGALRDDDGQRRGHLKLLLVDPGRRRAGIGRWLLGEIERTMREKGARTVEIDGAAPRYLLPGLPLAAEAALRLLESGGYELIETRRSMIAPLEGLASPPEEERLDEFTLRRATSDEAPWLRREIAREFSPNWAEEVAVSIRDAPSGTHVALAGDAANGTQRLLGFSCAGLWAPNAFGPIATHPDARGQGIGAALLRRCLGDLAARSERSAVISWIGPEAFYRRFARAELAPPYLALRKHLG